MLNLDKQFELVEKIEKILGLDYAIPNLIGNPHMDIIHSLVSKIEELEGKQNAKSSESDIATSPAVAPTETATATTDAGSAGSTAGDATGAK